MSEAKSGMDLLSDLINSGRHRTKPIPAEVREKVQMVRYSAPYAAGRVLRYFNRRIKLDVSPLPPPISCTSL